MKDWTLENACAFLRDELGLLDTTSVLVSGLNGRMLHEIAINPDASPILVRTLLAARFRNLELRLVGLDTLYCRRVDSDFLHCKLYSCD